MGPYREQAKRDEYKDEDEQVKKEIRCPAWVSGFLAVAVGLPLIGLGIDLQNKVSSYGHTLWAGIVAAALISLTMLIRSMDRWARGDVGF
jgi:hypothetical protein